SRAAPLAGFKAKKGFKRFRPGAGHLARGCALRIDLESTWFGLVSMRLKRAENGVAPAEGGDLPGQRQQIAPVAIGMKEGDEGKVVGCGQSTFELCQPTLYTRHQISRCD